MERINTHGGKRTSTAVARYKPTTFGWGPAEEANFEACKRTRAHQITLSYRDNKMRLCSFPDEFDPVRSTNITKVSMKNLSNEFLEQINEPLGFLPETFSGIPLGWSILEKES